MIIPQIRNVAIFWYAIKTAKQKRKRILPTFATRGSMSLFRSHSQNLREEFKCV